MDHEGRGVYAFDSERKLLSTDADEVGDGKEGAAGTCGSFPSDEEALIGELSSERVVAYICVQLKKVAEAIALMSQSMLATREGCHPFTFYHRVRPFLSAWKNNPTLPNGVLYKGVAEAVERQQFYGGSAAQSSLLPFLDIALGVSHASTKSQEFLLSMRDYMPRAHREFLVYMESVTCLRQFVSATLASHGIPIPWIAS